MTSLRLVDAESATDLTTYVGRAQGLDPSGDVRLQATGRVLATWTCVLPGHGVMGSGLVLGLRTYALAEPIAVPLDATVLLGTVADRLTHDLGVLTVPSTTTNPAWAALTPPRGGWEPRGEIAASEIEHAAREGIEAVATGAPTGSGAAVVGELRRRVWARPTHTIPSVPSGAAFGMHALRFLGPRGGRPPVLVHVSGAWTRLSTRSGYVLTR